jgi:predicted DNA-binding transcriptional regulator AlpA
VKAATGGADDRRLTIAELERRLATDRSTIWRWYSAKPPRFPRPHYLGFRRLWWLSEVLAWEVDRTTFNAPPAPPQAVPDFGPVESLVRR